jgi:iron complex outermembrane recepter protein
MSKNRHFRVVLAAAASAILAASAASADTNTVSAPQRGAADLELAEIVVTAEKRETALVKTPVTVNVISSDNIAERGGAIELRSVIQAVPDVIIGDGTAGLVAVTMRGVGTATTNQMLEQTIGLFIDGVYHPKSIDYHASLLDTERVEVIQGSQGVLFGQNTSIGAISVISKQPTQVFDSYIQGGYDTQYHSWNTTAAVNTPINDKFALRTSAAYSDSKGYVNDLSSHQFAPLDKRFVARTILSWQPTDNLDVKFKVQGSDESITGDGYQLTTLSPSQAAYASSLGVPAGALTAPYHTAVGNGAAPPFDPLGFPGIGTSIHTGDATLTVNDDLGGSTLTSVTGYNEFRYYNEFDADTTPLPIIDQTFREIFEQFSEELRIASPSGGRLEYLAGLFLFHQRDDFAGQNTFQNFYISPVLFLGGQSTTLIRTQTFDGSAFGQVRYHLTDKLALTAGVRVVDERRHGNFTGGTTVSGADPTNVIGFLKPVGPSIAATIHSVKPDESLNLSYQATNDLLLYGVISQGTKGAAFNNAVELQKTEPSPFVVQAMTADSAEIGAKLSILHGAGYVSGSVYYTHMRNFQDSFFNSATLSFNVRNINATSEGVDFDSRVTLTNWFSLWGSAAVNHAYLIDGEDMQRAPRFSGVVGGRFQWSPSDNAKLFFEPTYAYTTHYLLQSPLAAGNNIAVSHPDVDARIGVNFAASGLDVFLLGENLTDARYQVQAYGNPIGAGTVGVYNRPRTLTLNVRYSFGGPRSVSRP